MFFKIIYNIALTLVPIFVGKVIDSGLQSLNVNSNAGIKTQLVRGIILVITIAISYYITMKLSLVYLKKVRKQIEYDILKGVIDNNVDIAKATNVFVSEIDLVIEKYLKNIIKWPDLFIPLIIGLIYTFSVSYVSMLIMVGVLFVVMTINQIIVKPLSKTVQELEKTKEATNKIMLGFLNAMTTINIFAEDDFVNTRMNQEIKEKMSKELKLRNFEVLVEGINNFFAILMQLIPIIILALMVYNKTITTGEALSIILLFEKIVTPIEGIGNLKSAIGSVANLQQDMLNIIANSESEINDISESKSNNTEIKFVDVAYKYDNKYIFKKLNFEIANGNKYLLKGASGSGKSTIFKILTKQIIDFEGSVYINGVEIREVPKNDIYKAVGILLQQPQFIVGTVGENISFKENYDQEDIKNALFSANFENAISHISDDILEGYNNFSGGELQRIGLARIFYHEKKLLLLDEITSNLDKNSAREVEKTILNIKDRTIINISHRSFYDLEDEYDGVIDLANVNGL